MTGDHRRVTGRAPPRGRLSPAAGPGGLARALGRRGMDQGPATFAMPSRNMWITNSRIEPIRNRMLGRYGLPGSR